MLLISIKRILSHFEWFIQKVKTCDSDQNDNVGPSGPLIKAIAPMIDRVGHKGRGGLVERRGQVGREGQEGQVGGAG